MEELEALLPAVLAVDHRMLTREYPTLDGIQRAFTGGSVTVWNAHDIGADPEKIGRRGSPTWVRRILEPERQRAAAIVEDDKSTEVIARVLELLRAHNIFLKEEIRSRGDCEKF
jgi:electron transfer flavoprotein beta subunit